MIMSQNLYKGEITRAGSVEQKCPREHRLEILHKGFPLTEMNLCSFCGFVGGRGEGGGGGWGFVRRHVLILCESRDHRALSGRSDLSVESATVFLLSFFLVICAMLISHQKKNKTKKRSGFYLVHKKKSRVLMSLGVGSVTRKIFSSNPRIIKRTSVGFCRKTGFSFM